MNNLILFYLIVAISLLALAIVGYITWKSSDSGRSGGVVDKAKRPR